MPDILGTAGRDTLTGTAGADTLSGGDAGDRAFGGAQVVLVGVSMSSLTGDWIGN